MRTVVGSEDGIDIETIARRVAVLNMDHIGVSTEAEFVQRLRKSNSRQLNLLHMCKTDYLFADPTSFTYPAVGSGEEAVCQPFVTDCISAIQNGKVKYLPNSTGVWKKSKDQILYTTELVDAHSNASFGTRKPDIAGYAGRSRGPLAITMIGDVKGCGATTTVNFPDAQIGHILDMGRVLLAKHQLWRSFIYVFLTDGVRFVFFKIVREMSDFRYDMSVVYCAADGWQVRTARIPLIVF